MDDNQLDQVTEEVDNLLFSIVSKYQVDPLILSAIISGRLVHLNNAAGSLTDFKMLMQSVADTDTHEMEENIKSCPTPSFH